MANSGNKLNPCCPNHGCELNRTTTAGIGICPISGCRFVYDDTEEGTETCITQDGELCTRPRAIPIDAPKGGDPV